MGVTLIINPGSASKKYALWRDGGVVATYRFERNEQSYELCVEHNQTQQKCEGVTVSLYQSALAHVLATATGEGIIAADTDITTVGIRVVAPGTYFQQHRIIDGEYLAQLRTASSRAPLHAPHIVSELEQVAKVLPHATVVGVSDSAFHHTVPSAAHRYPLPVTDTETHDIRRFGYHGISYASIVPQFQKLLGERAGRVVACHIGSGMSMTALRDGQSIDTTMGFGPGSGLMMGARSGDIDPGAVLEVMRVKNFKPFDIDQYLQTHGGFWGLTGESDFRHLLERLAHEDEQVVEAFNQCVYAFQKQLGGYHIVLRGLDAIVLTATAVERSPALRRTLLRNLEWFGVIVDEEANELCVGQTGIISATDSPITVLVVRTDEQGEMYRITDRVASA